MGSRAWREYKREQYLAHGAALQEQQDYRAANHEYALLSRFNASTGMRPPKWYPDTRFRVMPAEMRTQTGPYPSAHLPGTDDVVFMEPGGAHVEMGGWHEGKGLPSWADRNWMSDYMKLQLASRAAQSRILDSYNGPGGPGGIGSSERPNPFPYTRSDDSLSLGTFGPMLDLLETPCNFRFRDTGEDDAQLAAAEGLCTDFAAQLQKLHQGMSYAQLNALKARLQKLLATAEATYANAAEPRNMPYFIGLMRNLVEELARYGAVAQVIAVGPNNQAADALFRLPPAAAPAAAPAEAAPGAAAAAPEGPAVGNAGEDPLRSPAVQSAYPGISSEVLSGNIGGLPAPRPAPRYGGLSDDALRSLNMLPGEPAAAPEVPAMAPEGDFRSSAAQGLYPGISGETFNGNLPVPPRQHRSDYAGLSDDVLESIGVQRDPPLPSLGSPSGLRRPSISDEGMRAQLEEWTQARRAEIERSAAERSAAEQRLAALNGQRAAVDEDFQRRRQQVDELRRSAQSASTARTAPPPPARTEEELRVQQELDDMGTPEARRAYAAAREAADERQRVRRDRYVADLRGHLDFQDAMAGRQTGAPAAAPARAAPVVSSRTRLLPGA